MSGWMSMFCGLGMHANCGGHTSSGGACACQCHGSGDPSPTETPSLLERGVDAPTRYHKNGDKR